MILVFTPSEEQLNAIQMAQNGDSFKISAFAGTGKTTTLKLISKDLHNKQFNYLAFNKAIATEAKSKFSANVNCSTFHAMAYRATPQHITSKLNYPRILPQEIATKLRLRPLTLPIDKKPLKSAEFSTSSQASTLLKSIDLFCRDNVSEPNQSHILNTLPDWIAESQRIPVSRQLTPALNYLWELLIDENTKFKISHDIYLKLWSLSKPIIPGDIILFDEAQDADPIMLNVLRSQSCQIIYVGDRNQAIYGFRGAVNAMDKLRIPETLLTQSFRFGEAVADYANLILEKLLTQHNKIKGNPSICSTVKYLSEVDTHIVRTNAGAIDLAISLVQDGLKPKVHINFSEILSQLNDARKLIHGLPLEPQSVFFGFNNWIEVENYVEQNIQSDITSIVNLISNYKIEGLIGIINNLSNHQHANTNCQIITAHKSKGLEFSTIRLHGDYFWDPLSPAKNKPLADINESRLIYVATTRAINNFDPGGMVDFFNLLKK